MYYVITFTLIVSLACQSGLLEVEENRSSSSLMMTIPVAGL